MAFYVKMTKIGEDNGSARYRFSDDDRRFGEVTLDKTSGNVSVVKPLTGSASEGVSTRAVAKLRSTWRRQAGGGMPPTVEWAS